MIVLLVVFALVLATDQISKSVVVARFPEGAATDGVIYGIRLRHVANRRGPWRSRAGARWMSVALLVFAGVSGWLSTVIASPWMYLGLGAILGGAVGNLVDGFNRNAVTDFIDLRVWPVFNIADAAIVTGAALMLWELAAM